MTPIRTVSIGASTIPPFLNASPMPNIPAPMFPRRMCMSVSIYLWIETNSIRNCQKKNNEKSENSILKSSKNAYDVGWSGWMPWPPPPPVSCPVRSYCFFIGLPLLRPFSQSKICNLDDISSCEERKIRLRKRKSLALIIISACERLQCYANLFLQYSFADEKLNCFLPPKKPLFSV